MTPWQTLTVATLGGLAALLGVILFLALAFGIYAVIARLVDIRDAHRERRRTLTEARRQLDALPTAHDPKERSR